MKQSIRNRKRTALSRRGLFCLAFSLCLLLSLFFTGCSGHPDEGGTTLTTSQAQNTDTDPETTTTTAEGTTRDPDTSTAPHADDREYSKYYPSLWKQLNAAVVKWGDITETSYMVDTCPPDYEEYKDRFPDVKYVGVRVEYVNILSDTMSDDKLTKAINDVDFILMPEYYAKDLHKGDMALVFLKGFYPAESVYLPTLVTGSLWSDGTFSEPALYAIENDRLVVPENYEANSPDFEKIRFHLEKGNRYMSNMRATQEVGEYPSFENGMTVLDLIKYFHALAVAHNVPTAWLYDPGKIGTVPG